MKEFPTNKIRNVCLAGQRGCGKTSLADAIAFSTGLNNRIGRVDDGSSLLDYTESEIARKTSLSSKLLACQWKDVKINLLDCQGHADFPGELIGSLRVADAAGVVIDAAAGVEIGTQLQWHAMGDHTGARFFFVNKLETENANWQNTVESITAAFGREAVAAQLPIGSADKLSGIVDLIRQKAFTFDTDGKPAETDIPSDMKDAVETAREQLVEMAAEAEDELTEKFLEEGSLNDADLHRGLSVGIASGRIYPILVGAAAKNFGVHLLLDFATAYLPSPEQSGPLKALKDSSEETQEVLCDSSAKPLLYVFKTISEGHLGETSLFRVFAGSVRPGAEFQNRQTGATERITQMYTFHGKNRDDVSSLAAGDIGATVKLKDTHTGNTLADGGLKLTVPPAEFPNPVMDVAIRPKSKGDEEKIAVSLQKIAEEDPTFRIVSDPALKQMVLYAQGSTHIEVITEKLKKRFGVEVELAKPRVPYRETVRAKAEHQYRHKKQSGGRGQFGEVHLRIEPNERSAGFEFLNEIKGGAIPSKYIPAVEKGVLEAMQHGGLAGAPVVDVKVAVYYGKYHEVDSSDMAFKIASSVAFKEGFMQAKPVLLEPIYNVEVLVPDDFTGDVMGDLSARRGTIAGMDPVGKHQRIRAAVPQAELYQYAVDLRSMTQGQGVYSMDFSHYEEVPHDTAQKIIEEARREREAE
ncbi:MAG: elongation factor G [Candidatus Zixiibacteriota bacterium]